MRPKPAARRPSGFSINVACLRTSDSQSFVAGLQDGRDSGVNMSSARCCRERAVSGEISPAQWKLDATFDPPVAHGSIALALRGNGKHWCQDYCDGEDAEIHGTQQSLKAVRRNARLDTILAVW